MLHVVSSPSSLRTQMYFWLLFLSAENKIETTADSLRLQAIHLHNIILCTYTLFYTWQLGHV